LHKIYAESLKGKYSLGDLEVDGRIILKCVLNKEDVVMGVGFYSSLSGGIL